MKLNLKRNYNILCLQKSCVSHDFSALILKFSLKTKLEIVATTLERLSSKKYSFSFPTLRLPEDYLKIKKIIC